MTKPTKIIIDGKMEVTDIKALQIIFDTAKETSAPYEVITIYDSSGGVQTYPINRVELIHQ
ncbi:MAG: hypothetical protein FWC91_01930 [Defluviitaleaceae bacterium]|nr:hypothetical protein [Defluviitaleaceae bacterium]